MSTQVELTVGGPKPTSSARLVATLSIAGMLSGFLLAASYQVTKPIIDANQARELRESVYKVVPGSTSVQRLVYREGALLPIDETEKTGEPVVFAAYDAAGRFCGYGVVNEGAGFADQVRLIYGFDPASKKILGMKVLASKETPGLGDKITKDAKFIANFDSLSIATPVVVVKGGRNADNQVDAITGATISSKAVVRIVNEANTFWSGKLPPPGAEPPPPTRSEGGTP
ncbi:MAG: FMN-binding protein [Phycisphaerales bacterium]|nr:FMN-binding protein [Phycisphaerales bacterium]